MCQIQKGYEKISRLGLIVKKKFMKKKNSSFGSKEKKTIYIIKQDIRIYIFHQ